MTENEFLYIYIYSIVSFSLNGYSGRNILPFLQLAATVTKVNNSVIEGEMMLELHKTLEIGAIFLSNF